MNISTNKKIKLPIKRKSSYELGKNLFGRYGSSKIDLSSTYKDRMKEKIKKKLFDRQNMTIKLYIILEILR